MKRLRIAATSMVLLGVSQLASCAALFEYPQTDAEESAAACNDGLDNDIDGRSDCFDPACAIYCQELDEATCRDGVDNDVDGRTDCSDVDCKAFCPESDAITCADDRDNDFDGTTDCDDRDCDGYCPELTAAECADGRDNDGDGQTDSADARCWPLAPPGIRRCATLAGTEFEERFDDLSSSSDFEPRWYAFGQYSTEDEPDPVNVASSIYRLPQLTTRTDYVAQFTLNTSGASSLGDNLGGIGTHRTFSGGWQGFQLSFAALVNTGTALRVALIPQELAEDGRTPSRASESALVALTLDGAANPPVFALDVEGRRVSARLPPLGGCGLYFCDDGWRSVSVSVEGDKLVAKVTGSGADVSVEAPMPVAPVISSARLIIAGGSIAAELNSRMDDVRLRLGTESPCGYQVPQIPSAICAYQPLIAAAGHTVSIAGAEAGEICALVSTSRVAGSGEPDAVSSWRSNDGQIWLSGPESQPGEETISELSLADGAVVVGAGIVRDDTEQRWAAVVAYREETGVRLALSWSSDCIDWMPPEESVALPADAEAPSYIITSAEHQIYFTRPPNDQTLRTLWRVSGTSAATLMLEDAPVSELPAEASISAPVAVQRVGNQDLVLSYRLLPISGARGGGLLVSDETARNWQALPSVPQLPASDLAAAFDGTDISAVALSFGPQGGLLFYSGLGSRVTAGTALIAPAGIDLGALPLPEAARCGDDSCEGAESCDTCPSDCPCPGVTLLDNPFEEDSAWQVASEVLIPENFHYVDSVNDQLNWGSSYAPLWSILPLEQALTGDFELAFDFTMPASSYAYCDSAYVGLGVAPTVLEYNPVGAFVRITYDAPCFSEEIGLSAMARTSSGSFSSLGLLSYNVCSEGAVAMSPDTRRRVILRRSAGNVTVRVVNELGCDETQSVAYTGAMPPLEALLVGHGGPYDAGDGTWSSDCGGVSGSITNLQLRLLDDVNACPSGSVVCESGTEPTCVDTDSTPEHCGGCFQACGVGLLCGGSGTCVCSPNLTDCGSACVDTSISLEHCGSCGNACTSYCFLNECDLGESCTDPKPLPATGGTTTFSFEGRVTHYASLCNFTASSDVAFSWTPSVSGTATIEVEGVPIDLDTVIAVSSDAACVSFEANGCNDITSALGGGARVVIPVVGGTTYRIVAALWGSSPSATGTAELRIQVN